MKNTILTFKNAKQEGKKIAMLTAYDYTTAKLLDEAEIDAILVGDSLGNVMLGLEDTVSVTMENMIHHTAAVARGVKKSFIVADMPFMSYQTSVYDAVVNAGRLIKEGRANAVKLEGGACYQQHIKAIVDASIPVMGHLGMTPQSVNALGGFKVQGRTLDAAKKMLEDILAIEEAGAFAVVLECVPAKLAAYLTERTSMTTIGIGAGAGCDGQVLVNQDMFGMYSDMSPKFVKKFAEIGTMMKDAVLQYKKEVQESQFPGQEHGYKIDDAVIDALPRQ